MPPLVRSPELRQPLAPVKQADRLFTFLTGGLAVFQGLIIQPVQLPQAFVHQRAFCLTQLVISKDYSTQNR